jgi:quercetin dioxygenase-like cupin family protein
MRAGKAAVSGVVGIGLAAALASTAPGRPGPLAQSIGFSRVVLQDQPLGLDNRHTVTARAQFEPGGAAGWHSHPGEEIGYALEGVVELSVAGRSPIQLKAGDAFFIPAGVAHNGRNLGQGRAALLSVFVLENGKPVATPAKAPSAQPVDKRP